MSRRAALLAATFVLLLVTATRQFAGPSPITPLQDNPLRWYKGNTHTHTINSDGDSTPEQVVRWYREHGYNFLVLSDHNFLTSVDGLNAVHGAQQQFTVIRGEEVTDRFGQKPLHVNGLNVERKVDPQGGGSVTHVLQRNVDAIRAASGVPHINHPNFQWAITTEELKEVRNYRLLEIFNGHPRVNNLGQGGSGPPGMEAMWDTILSSGRLTYGIAVDDAHVFKRPWDRSAARPGQGWVMVRAERLTSQVVMEALERGDFYASTGVELADYRVTRDSFTVIVREAQGSKYRVAFVGKAGRVLDEQIENPAVYRFRGDELYVRATVYESNGAKAWLQPVMLRSP